MRTHRAPTALTIAEPMAAKAESPVFDAETAKAEPADTEDPPKEEL